jgi:MFS family permease
MNQATVEGDDSRPPVLRDVSFWGLTFTQFLGAFNDNVYKQIVLLLALPVAAKAANPDAALSSEDLQGWATFVFSLPFVLFSGFAGYLSDRFSKTPIIVGSKVAEIVVMLLCVVAFLNYDRWGMYGTWTVLFLLATQATFFGPGKYGILPELFRPSDLARANGLILMTTFLAIIFGVMFAGSLMKWIGGDGIAGNTGRLWIGSFVCLGLAVLGTLTSLMIRRTKPAQPDAKLTMDSFGVNRDMFQLLKKDTALLYALLVSCVFWMVASIAMPTVNRVGQDMLSLDMEATSILVGMIAVGIMLGAPLGGMLCRKLPSHLSVTLGLWGIVICLGLLGIWNGEKLWLGLNASRISLIMLGVSAAVYSIPLQVFLQSRPPTQLKGRMIAMMNQANFLGMLLAGPLYQLFILIADRLGMPISSVFWMIGLLVLPLAMFYHMGAGPAPVADAELTTAA